MVDPNIASIVNTAIGALPGILAMIRSEHKANVPDAPELTDAQVFAALHDAVTQTVAKDDELAADIRKRNNLDGEDSATDSKG